LAAFALGVTVLDYTDAGLERRHHPHECCTARRLRRRRPRQLHRPAEGAHRPGRARRPVPGRARHLRRRRRRRPPDPVGRLLPEHPVARRHEPAPTSSTA